MRVLAIIGVVCASLGRAVAQSPSDVEQAHAIFVEGRALLTSNNTKAACEKFEASIALDPTAPGVMLNLGLCYELLEKYATSLYWFRKAQIAAAEALLTEYEDEAKRRTLALVAKVSILKLDASATPAGTEIRIDGKLVAPTDYARIEVDRGAHSLEVRASGKQMYRRSFEVTSSDAGTIAIPALLDEPRAAPLVAGPGDTGASPSGLGRTVLAASFGAAGLGLCVASPLWARHTQRAYDQAVANMEMPSYSAARNKQHIATGMFITGLGLIGFGTYVYLTTPSRNTAVAPIVGVHQVGITISGSL